LFEFTGYQRCAKRFYDELGTLRRKEVKDVKDVAKPTKKRPLRVTVSSGSVEAFIGRSLERAKKIDHGQRLPSETTVTFEDTAKCSRS
jgi:hypothetical protein